MNTQKEQDIENGDKYEKFVGVFLKMKYKTIEKMEDKYCPIDFIDHENLICFEVKSTEELDLSSYRFGEDKYIWYENNYQMKGYSFMLVYSIGGNITYTYINNPRKNNRMDLWGRTNRGKKERKKWYVCVDRHLFKYHSIQLKPRMDILPLDYHKNLNELNVCDLFDDD